MEVNPRSAPPKTFFLYSYLGELRWKMNLKWSSNSSFTLLKINRSIKYHYFLTWTRRCLGLGPLLRYPISCSWRSLWERKTAANQWNHLTEMSHCCIATQRHVCPPQAQLDNTEPMLQVGGTLPESGIYSTQIQAAYICFIVMCLPFHSILTFLHVNTSLPQTAKQRLQMRLLPPYNTQYPM